MNKTYLQKIEIMSLWEVGHRWSGFDPDDTNQENLPKAVTEKLRELLAAVSAVLNLHNKSGQEYLASFIPIVRRIIPNKILKRAAELLHTRQFPKKDLDSLFVREAEVEKWC